MADIRSRSQDINREAETRDVSKIAEKADNIYRALAIVSERSKSLAREIKIELHNKLEEFSEQSDTIEEIQENKEQIEISKFYEKMPNPVNIAMAEYLGGHLEFRHRTEE